MKRHCEGVEARLRSSPVSSWGVSVRALAVGAALLAACSEDEPSASTTTTTIEPTTTLAPTTTTSAPERPASTTTTAFDPATVEGEVEAAYLRSWDVYADAVYNLELDEEALAEAYIGRSLAGKVEELRDRIADGRAALVLIEHDYEVVVFSADRANVIDRFTNHQVLIDPVTKEPVEEDPNQVVTFNFVMERSSADGWRVEFIERIRP